MIEKIQCENCGGTDMVQVGRGLFRCESCGTIYHSDITQVVKPQQTYLFTTIIAGTTHVTGIDDLVADLEYGSYLSFRRQEDNEYDKKAILVLDIDGRKLGYVPETENLILSRLMDGGQEAYGVVEDIEKRGNWNRITMDVFAMTGGVRA